MKRHGTTKEYMFVNRRWRRRLQALLGRGMADDGRAARPTVGTAGTPRSPTRAGTRRDAIRRRAIRHAIRRRAIRHATTFPQRRAIPHTTGHTGRRDRRRTIRHATILSYREMPGNARKCPEYVRNMFGICSDIPGDVSLPSLSGNHF